MAKANGPTRPSERTVKRLFALSGNQCAFPGCDRHLVDPTSGSVLGQICHIKGDKEGAARYDASQTNRERHGFDNLILLCGVHHKIIDDDGQTYTVDRLREMKATHETQHRDAPVSMNHATAKQFILNISNVVQIADTITNVFSAPSPVDLAELLTPNASPLPPNVRNPASLLNARHQVVPFLDAPRQREMEAIETWRAADEPASVRLFVGPGGTGKTRLFIEWVKRLSRRGWRAGFLRERRAAAELDALVACPDPLLVVVDYAEARPDVLELLRRAARRPAAGAVLRVALLAREVADWWPALAQQDADVAPLLARHEPLRLAPVPLEGTLRQEAFAAAVRAFDETRKDRQIENGRESEGDRPVVAAQKSGRSPASPDLSDRRFGQMLYLHMAALARVEGLSLSADSLLDDVVAHEGRYWLRRYPERYPADPLDRCAFAAGARRVVAAATLLGGLPTVEAVKRTIQCVDGPLLKNFPEFLRWLYPGRGGPQSQDAFVAPLEPDLLGQALVARALSDRATREDYLDRVFDDADAPSTTNGFLVLGRLAEDRPEARPWIERALGRDVPARAEAAFAAALALGEKTAGSPLGLVLASALQREGTTELARAFEDRLPKETVSLRELRVWTVWRLLEQFPEDQTTEEALPERARLLNNLGVFLSELGRREEALEATRDAVEIRRALARGRRDAFLPHLAGSLNNLSARLSELGQREEALEAASESVEIRRELVRQGGHAFLPDLARSLNNLGIRLSELARQEEALQATQEAVKHYRTLTGKRCSVFLGDLARSLSNLGNCLSELGRLEEALKVTRESVKHYRTLSRQRPDAFLPVLMGTLSNLGNRLGELGRWEEALEAAHEAVECYGALAAKRPDAFLPHLAMSLNNLGGVLSALGRWEEALEATREAVEIRRPLAGRWRDAFSPDLAGSLDNLGRCLGALGQEEEARKATDEAAEIRRARASKRPDAGEPR
ncbi:MAG: tetratricopeptide repeat protein [Pirellulales bacterium]|nr:tetratricopeptide repeat protein [Pirellulales bacterium]